MKIRKTKKLKPVKDPDAITSCGHRGKLWLDSDSKWQCLKCGHEEKFQCKHEKRRPLGGEAEEAGYEWCEACRRPVAIDLA